MLMVEFGRFSKRTGLFNEEYESCFKEYERYVKDTCYTLIQGHWPYCQWSYFKDRDFPPETCRCDYYIQLPKTLGKKIVQLIGTEYILDNMKNKK